MNFGGVCGYSLCSSVGVVGYICECSLGAFVSAVWGHFCVTVWAQFGRSLGEFTCDHSPCPHLDLTLNLVFSHLDLTLNFSSP